MATKKYLLLLFFSLSLFTSISQTCTNLGQNPETAFPVCGSSVFTQNSVPICGTSTIPTPCTASAVVFQDKNPFWYKFTCFVSGLFAFVITPNNLGDDYDWQIFDITNRNPTDVYTDPTLFVACNWSGNFGVTGASAAGTSLVWCEGNVPTFSSMPMLIQGHNYIMLVSHFTNSQSGYSLSFGGGTAVITDTIGVPKMLKATATCDGLKIGIKLNKKLKCNSLAANGTDFSIATTTSTIVSAAGDSCTTGFDLDSLVLTLNTPLAGGTYTITIKNGTDGNTLLDNCGTPITIGDQVTFTLVPPQLPTYDSIVPVKCTPDELRIILKTPILCTSVAPDGSDFIISGPAPVSIVSATTTCINSLTTEIILKLSSPIYKKGIYTVSLVNGSDGNTIQNICGQNAVLGLFKTFTAYDTVSAIFTYAVSYKCLSDTVSFFHNGNNGVNLWNWTFDNTSTSTLQNPVKGYSIFGNHTVKLIVSNGVCSDTVSSILNLPSRIPINLVLTKNATTCGLMNGTATVKASGGAGGFLYLWTPGNFTSDSISNLSPGTYTVKITDANGCIKIDSIVVNAITSPQINNITGTDVKCFGQKGGSALASVSGGLLPYSFSWTKGITTFTGNPIQNLDTGKYVLIVKDARGCSDTANVIINQPQKLSNAVNITPTSCGLSNGSAAIAESGGILPYAFVWSPSGGNNATANNLAAGTYKIRVTDKNGCRDSAQIIIATSSPLTATVSISNVTCIGGNNGSATVTSFGTAPYGYSWFPSGGSNATANGLAVGNYVATITDNKGCIDTLHVAIIVTNPLVISVTDTNATCNLSNGTASVSASGGKGKYTYNWMPGNFNTAAISNLSPGKYIVTVTDSVGCQKKDSIMVNAVPVPQINNITGTDVKCFGQKGGSALASVSGGLLPYSFSWTNGITTFTGNPIQNLDTGKYVLIVKDSRGCSDTSSVIINQPQKLRNAVNVTPTSCGLSNGSAAITESGGILPYIFVWSPSGGSNATANNLAAGTYNIRVTDKNGCKDSAQIIIATSSPLTATVSISNVTCIGGNNGSATVTPFGTSPYGYLWSPSGGNNATANGLAAGNYVATITDNKGCIDTLHVNVVVQNPLTITIGNVKNISCNGGSDGSISIAATGSGPFIYTWLPSGGGNVTATNLSVGIYKVIVKDARGCALADSVALSQPPPIVTTTTHNSTTCALNNGVASVTASGGVGSFSYLWTPGNDTTTQINNLAPANYMVAVTDKNGCKKIDNALIKAIPVVKIANIIPSDVLCKGGQTGSAIANVINGTLPYTYSWSNGTQVIAGNVLQNVSIGKYILTVMDSAGCIAKDSIFINEPEVLRIASFPSNTLCGLNNGKVTATGVGGKPPYRFHWSTGVVADSTIGLSPGNYSVTTTDANGCTAVDNNIKILSSKSLTISLGNDFNVCPGVEVKLSPGLFVSYLWQDNSKDSIFKANYPGIYSVRVTDNRGCIAIAKIELKNQCDDIVFPSGFTPNGDGKNEGFGPLGTLYAVSDYRLNIYNRWGQTIFATTNPFFKWNGKMKDKILATGTYVWIAEYSFNKMPKKVKKGTILLIK